MKGRRIDLDTDDDLKKLLPGDYGQRENGTWVARMPHEIVPEGKEVEFTDRYFVVLVGWKVDEHEDNSITVSPSIYFCPHEGKPREWHGFLERGTWREC